MKEKTQKQIILEYLKDLNDWQFEYKIRAINTPFGWIGARGDRNVRQLIKDGKIDHDMKGKYRIVKHKEVNIGKLLPQSSITIKIKDGLPIAVNNTPPIYTVQV